MNSGFEVLNFKLLGVSEIKHPDTFYILKT